ncbi:2-oxoacid:acceptor oxidoreductase subunit alpha [Candidatus Aerophobetes bacterium]|uniref:2-oxoacid:acceptor oxidoreductase subunit alpha n=1 Tax=Aerophobetes bacterium TaxID=2030807 RepID=A0A523W0B8_UNCAE|nr:MAG: 2-oxoacid:acceptor oxidoreductase subunit alpha [Candidatus Aerophobetes bacterium]
MNRRVLSGVHLFQGDEACAEGAIAAGCNLFAGYPITPATEVSERLSWRLFDVGGIFVQGADELDSLTIVIGAACGGWKAMTATSGNGICLMQECIGYAAITETPCVIVDVQRAGPGTGVATKTMQGDVYQVRYGSNADYSIIALVPDSPQEMFDLTVEAFNLSEIYRVPTFILADEIVGHMREKVVIPDKVRVVERRKPKAWSKDFVPFKVESDTDVPPMPAFGEGYRMPVSGLTHTETGSPSTSYEVQKALVERLCNKVEKKVEDLTRVETEFMEDAEIVVVSYGSTARSAKRAVIEARKEGIKAGYLRLITLWPFPDSYLKRVADKIPKGIIVPEMNVGKMVREVERSVGTQVEVLSLPKPGVELHRPSEIYNLIRKVN